MGSIASGQQTGDSAYEASEKDYDELRRFGRKAEGDLETLLARVYSRGHTLDEEALEQIFRFSASFETLDGKAKAYGQLIFNSFLNLGEWYGTDVYGRVLDRQPPEIQQRIRDFISYPTVKLSKDSSVATIRRTLDEDSEMYPAIFPKGFLFGRGDPLFAGALDAKE